MAPYKIGSSEQEYMEKNKRRDIIENANAHTNTHTHTYSRTSRRPAEERAQKKAFDDPTAITKLISTTSKEEDLNIHLHLTKQEEELERWPSSRHPTTPREVEVSYGNEVIH
uniref:Predicted protein n=1 Tax=Hordeum vulgare subsp. vulgare TaxID=112509 RepID=F2E8T6_HORVV|nr:predicted protein [Hordeum vulgare subsp. vulgare]